MKRGIAGILAGVLAVGGMCFPVLADEWDWSEDGKHWMYYDYSGEPLKDEWIEDNGNTYYVDSNGYMKTGWVKNSDDGNKYYLGEDGAMVKNAFTPDDKFVGPDGVVVEKYDNYRKKVKAEINKAGKNGGTRRKTAGKGTEEVKQPYFLLVDLNQDGIRDIVVMEAFAPEEMGQISGQTAGVDISQGGNNLDAGPKGSIEQIAGSGAAVPAVLTGGTLVEIAVWDVETAAFQLAAEFDESGEGENSTLYLDPQGEGIWLEIMENEESLRLFQMEVDTSRFKSVHSFSMELDDWGGPEYFIDGSVEDKESWDAAIAEAKQLRGNVPVTGYLAVNDENIKAQVDLMLTADDLYLWEGEN